MRHPSLATYVATSIRVSMLTLHHCCSLWTSLRWCLVSGSGRRNPAIVFIPSWISRSGWRHGTPFRTLASSWQETGHHSHPALAHHQDIPLSTMSPRHIRHRNLQEVQVYSTRLLVHPFVPDAWLPQVTPGQRVSKTAQMSSAELKHPYDMLNLSGSSRDIMTKFGFSSC